MKKSIKFIISGAVLFFGSLIFGVGGTVISLIYSFNQMSSFEQANPDQLAEGISSSLIATLVGIPIAFIGFCLLVGGLIAYLVGRFRKQTGAETV